MTKGLQRYRNLALRISVGMLSAFALNQSALACMPDLPLVKEAGESDEAFEVRIKAQRDARLAHENAPVHERAVVDQSRMWDTAAMVFLARIEKVKVGGRVYPAAAISTPSAAKLKRGAIPPPPKQIEPLSLFETHSAYIRPLRWLKGEPGFQASWRTVGGASSCGGSPDGSLGYTYPGDLVIVFASDVTSFHHRRGVWSESRELSLFGIDPDEAAAPPLLVALENKSGVEH